MGLVTSQQSAADVLHAAYSGANVGTSETDMSSYSLPAGTLGTDGKSLRITAWGVTAATANLKTVKIYFGATEMSRPIANNAANDIGWWSLGYVVRTGAATQNAFARSGMGTHVVGTNESSNDVMVVTPGETMSGAITIKVTGQDAAASNGTLLKGFIIELLS